MLKNVVMLFGVNGVGKTTLAKALGTYVEDSKVIYASEVLRELFGGVSRRVLTHYTPEAKMQVMKPAFIRLFKKFGPKKLVIMDTHLLVPIRNGAVVYENIWSPEYAKFVKAAFYLSAPTPVIWWRRYSKRNDRTRDMNPAHIWVDQLKNRLLFERMLRKGEIEGKKLQAVCPSEVLVSKVIEHTKL